MLWRRPCSLIRTRVRLLCLWGGVGLTALGTGSSILWAEQRSITVDVSASIPERLEMAVEAVPTPATAAVTVPPDTETSRRVTPALGDIRSDGNLAPPTHLRREWTDVLADAHHLTATREYPLPTAAEDSLVPGGARHISYQFRVEPGAPSEAPRGTLLVTFTAQ